MTGTNTLDRSGFTDTRTRYRDCGWTVTLELRIVPLPHDDEDALIRCTLCAQPAALGVAVEQDYINPTGWTPEDRDASSTDDYLCADCADTTAPGLLRAARDQHAAEDAIRAYRDKAYLTDWDNALDRVQSAAPAVLRRLGFDESTIAEAAAYRPDSIILSTHVAGFRIVGAHVPGGEVHFMADDADPDGH